MESSKWASDTRKQTSPGGFTATDGIAVSVTTRPTFSTDYEGIDNGLLWHFGRCTLFALSLFPAVWLKFVTMFISYKWFIWERAE